MFIPLSLLFSVALAYMPVIKDTYFAITTVKKMAVAGFKMDFNDTIFVKHKNGAKFLLSDPSMFKAAPYPILQSSNCNQGNNGGSQNFNGTLQSLNNTGNPPSGPGSNGGNRCSENGPSVLPNATILLQNLFSVTCSSPGGAITKMDSSFNGPFDPSDPHFPYMVGPPSTDPIATILNVATGGVNINPTVFNNRAYFARILGTPAMLALFSDPAFKCTVIGNSTSSFKLVNGNDEEVKYPIVISQKPPQCTYEGAMAVADTIKAISNFADSMSTQEQLNQLENAFDVLGAMESFAGCDAFIRQFLTFTNSTLELPNSRECPYRYGDPLWATSPCCNHEIIDQCCAPSSRFLTVNVIKSIDSDAISQTCNHPAQIQALFSLLATATNNGALKAPINPRTEFESYTKFMSVCQDDVFSKSCSSNSDCAYSKQCGQNNFCNVDYQNSGPVLFACYAANMKSGLLTELQRALDLPTSYASSDDQVSALVDAISPLVNTDSCMGPSGRDYNGYYSQTKDADGNFDNKYTPADKEGCLRNKVCNYESWNRKTQDQCTADHLPGYCSIGTHFPISNPSKCLINIPKDANTNQALSLCNSVNGRFVESPSYNQCYLDAFQSNKTGCLNATQRMTCGTNSNGDWDCAQGFCKGPEKNQTECDSADPSYQPTWTSSLYGSACKYLLPIDQCKQRNLSFIPGVYYYTGQYDTQSSCPQNICFDTINGDRTNKSNSKCSQYSCTVCNSFKFSEGACFNTTITTQAACIASSTDFDSNDWAPDPLVAGKGLCEKKYIQKDTCKQNNLTFLNPADAGLNATKCSQFPSALQAFMQSNRQCPDKSSCEASGQCDDWEYDQQSFSGTSSGVCVYVPSNPWQCGGNRQTRMGKCINSTITSNSDCTSLGFSWKTRAKTEAECLALGSYCNLPDGHFTTVSASQCESCGGTVRYAYRWSKPVWKSSEFVSSTWVSPVNWTSENTFGPSIDFGKVNRLLSDSIAHLIVQDMIRDFNEQKTLLSNVFSTVACDCVAKKNDCFSSMIRSPLGSCTSDVTSSSSCQGVKIAPGNFNGSIPVSTTATLISAASFVGSSGSQRKRAVSSTKANYKVVKNSVGSLVGQIVGNAVSYEFSKSPITSLGLCLTIDASIPLDRTEFPNYDIAQVYSNGTLSPAFYLANVTVSGNSICGTVPAFKNASFIPIARNFIQQKDVIISTTTETSAVGNNNNAAPLTASSTKSAKDVIISTTTETSALGNNHNNNAAPLTASSTDSSKSAATSSKPERLNNLLITMGIVFVSFFL